MKKTEFQGIPITLDRPKGFVQEGTDESGKPWRRVYRYDYGFIPKTEGGDGEDVDVFLGPSATAPIAWWALQNKSDGSFDEFKVFLGFSSFELASACYRIHIPPRFCAGWAPIPVAMIKSLLGLAPVAVIKALRKAAMKNKTKTHKIAGVSFEEVTSALADALRAAYPGDPTDQCSPCPWPTEVYDDRVIYSNNGKYFEEGFTYANGTVTLAGSPKEVVRAYVPAGSQAQVAQGQQKSEGVMKNGKKSVKKSGAGDIVSLAAERLGEIAKLLGKGDGLITPEIKAGLDAVGALIETATGLYTGAGATDEGEEGDDDLELEELDMAALADAEKRGAVVKMTGTQLIAWAFQQMTKIQAETDPVRKEARMVNLEKALTYASLYATSAFSGTTEPSFPVSLMAEQGPAAVAAPSGGGEPGSLGPAATGGATSPGGTTATTHGITGSGTFTQKIADVKKAIDRLRGVNEHAVGAAAPAKEEVKKGVPGSTETGLWPASYVDSLPDSAFLYVETSAQKNAAGLTLPGFRHFPIRDMDGRLSKVQLAHAIKSIPTFGGTTEFKTDLLQKAQSLFGLEESIEKSSSAAGARGDDGWPDDMSDPDFMLGRRPARGTKTFGFDNLHSKADEIAKSSTTAE